MVKYTPWEDYEKYRAEQYKHLGYVFLTPFASMILEMFIGSPHWDVYYIIKLLISLIFGHIGWKCVGKSFKIMYSVEREKMYANL